MTCCHAFSDLRCKIQLVAASFKALQHVTTTNTTWSEQTPSHPSSSSKSQCTTKLYYIRSSSIMQHPQSVSATLTVRINLYGHQFWICIRACHMNGNIAARLLTEWYAVLYMQQYHNNRCLGKAASFPAPNSLCDARHLPTSTHRAIHRCQATEKMLSCQDMQHTNKDKDITICSWRVLLLQYCQRTPWCAGDRRYNFPCLCSIATTSASQRQHSAASITFPNMQARQCADVNETG